MTVWSTANVVNYISFAFSSLLHLWSLQPLLGQDGHDQQPHGQVRALSFYYLQYCDIYALVWIYWHLHLAPVFINFVLQAILGQDGHDQQPHGQVILSFNLLEILHPHFGTSFLMSKKHLNAVLMLYLLLLSHRHFWDRMDMISSLMDR